MISMNRIFCNCLNIIIDALPDGSRRVPGEKLLGSENVKDSFFISDVLEVQLGLGGIEMQQPLLIQERIVDDWKIFHCTNCNQDTHAIHKVKGLERVFGNLMLLRSSEDINAPKGNLDYSPVFKVVLNQLGKGIEEDVSTGMLQQNLGPAMQIVNAMVKKYLKLQEDAMQERIRLFVEKQKQQYEEVHRKAMRDKKLFIRALLVKEENSMKDSLSDAMREPAFQIGSAEERGDQFSYDIPTFTRSGNRAIARTHRLDQNLNPTGSLPLPRTAPVPSRVLGSKIRESPLVKTVRTPTKQQSTMRRRNKTDVDEDTLFDLEGFQDNRDCQPFFESDEDSSGDSNSLESSGGFGYPIAGRGFAGERVFATSVPVGIPQIEIQRKLSYEEEEAYEGDVALSPERMAESIKAIARSMQDSTSMFGDLPRPRYNTLPLK